MTLVLDGVKKKYKKFELDMTMVVETGSVTGLIGKNGAGKRKRSTSILRNVKKS